MGDYQTNTNQQGDVLLYQSPKDYGEINEANGLIEMTRGYETMAYLALFGGNEEDDGSQATEKLQWWGNDGETEEQQYRGRFQSMLAGTPLTSSSLRALSDAAREDLSDAFLPNYAASIRVIATITAPKTVKLDILIELFNAEVIPITFEGLEAAA